jgi:hypothetical protein
MDVAGFAATFYLNQSINPSMYTYISLSIYINTYLFQAY